MTVYDIVISLTIWNLEKKRGKTVKSTGIVRKVDEWGRIVPPSEVRRTRGMAEGDALEVYVGGSCVILERF